MVQTGRSRLVRSRLAAIVKLGLIPVLVVLVAVSSGTASPPREKRKPLEHKPVGHKPLEHKPVVPPPVVVPPVTSPSGTATSGTAPAPVAPPVKVGTMVVYAFNDLGMHCMNPGYREMCVLPPYNNMHAQVIDRSGEDPYIVTSGITVSYSVPGNTYSVATKTGQFNKTDFWTFAQALFHLSSPLPANIGLTGNGLSGNMSTTGNGDWAATAIPIIPIDDYNRSAPYGMAQITVKKGTTITAQTAAVIPVSTEINCNLCHSNQPGSIAPYFPAATTVESQILMAHDALHGTNLINNRPVLCASCHADPAMSTTGVAGVKTFSSAMHGSHSDPARWAALITQLQAAGSSMSKYLNVIQNNQCYTCHPGVSTDCLRDVHKANGMTCTDCHGSMTKVADPTRTPWVSEPTCGGCHQARQPTFQFEEPGKLFKNSRGHHGVLCGSCHSSPHAVTPAVVNVHPNTVPDADNYQAIQLQGHAGEIDTCTLCHRNRPDDTFPHRLSGGD